jgi:hypothetical protein
MGDASPRIFAGHSMLCPYEEMATAERMGVVMPSMCAGHGMPCPYEGKIKSPSYARGEDDCGYRIVERHRDA